MPETSLKVCTRCGEEVPVDNFPWKNRARGVRRTWCRQCAKAYARQHYLDNIDKYKAKACRNRRSIVNECGGSSRII